jgi:hypothetical protein
LADLHPANLPTKDLTRLDPTKDLTRLDPFTFTSINVAAATGMQTLAKSCPMPAMARARPRKRTNQC